jgi:ATP-dependent protease ClpP protease subunit
MKWWSLSDGQLFLFGEVAFESAEPLLAALKDVESIDLVLNVNGGCGKTAFQIFEALRGKVQRARISGRCVSAGVIIAMAAPRIEMDDNAHVTIHSPAIAVYGSRQRLAMALACFDEIAESCIRTVSERRRIKRKTVERWYLDGEEHLFTAADALKSGLIDEIVPAPPRVPAPRAMAGAPIRTEDEALVLEVLGAFGQVRCVNREAFAKNVGSWFSQNVREENQ